MDGLLRILKSLLKAGRGSTLMVDAGRLTLVDVDAGGTVVSELEVADGFRARFFGLMGRDRLQSHQGLLLRRCNSVHTCFMKFPIDLIYLDKEHKALSAVPAVPPWRVLFGVKGADSVIELPAGVLARIGRIVGHKIEVRKES